MRDADQTAGDVGTAQNDAFFNKYSTPSAAEAKAEIWATCTELIGASVSPRGQAAAGARGHAGLGDGLAEYGGSLHAYVPSERVRRQAMRLNR